MTEQSSNSVQQLCELLDQYVVAVQSGDETARRALRLTHPEVSSWADSLDWLDELAVDRRPAMSRLLPTVSFPTPSSSSSMLAEPQGSSQAQAVEVGSPTGGSSNQFGKYELLEEAGRGGMGVVYRARQTDLNRTVALKMILASRLASGEDVRRFQQEARAAAGIRHPHIVAIHEVGQVNGQHFFTMDFVVGESLAKILQRGPLPAERATRYIGAVARAVEFLHGQGIVHRDLKPSNILIDERDQPLVTDFGLAKFFQDDAGATQTGLILGTPSYMAPEQARGQSSLVSPRTDVYGLGAVLYELLTGQPPFREDSQLSTILQVLEGEPTPPTLIDKRLPRELERICLRALEKSPDDRYPTAVALADDLDRFLREEPLAIPAVGMRQQLQRWMRRQPALSSHSAGILAMAAIVGVNYLVQRPGWALFSEIMSVMAIWLAASMGFQILLDQPRRAAMARLGWAIVDTTLLTVLLYLSGPPLGPLVIGYPLLIAASGLWFRVRLVYLTTALSLVGYGLLNLLIADPSQPLHYRLIFAAGLTITGIVVAYPIERIRALSQYFKRRTEV